MSHTRKEDPMTLLLPFYLVFKSIFWIYNFNNLKIQHVLLVCYFITLSTMAKFAFDDAEHSSFFQDQAVLYKMQVIANLSWLLFGYFQIRKGVDHERALNKKITDFDTCMEKYLGISFNTRGRTVKERNVQLFIYLLILVYLIIETCMDVFYFKLNMWNAIIDGLCKSTTNLVLIIQVVRLSTVRWRFSFLNYYLKSEYNKIYMAPKSVSGLDFTMFYWEAKEYQISADITLGEFQKFKEKVSMVRSFHDYLGDVLVFWNQTVGTFMAGFYPFLIFYQLKAMFDFFIIISNQPLYGDDVYYLMFIKLCDLCFAYITEYFTLVSSGKRLRNEKLKAGDLIQNMYLKCNYKDYTRKAYGLFALQNKESQIQISANGMFILSYGQLLGSVLEVLSLFSFVLQNHVNNTLKPSEATQAT